MQTPAWFLSLLDDPRVTDICVNGPTQAYADRGQGLEPCLEIDQPWPPEAMKSWALEQLSRAGRGWDARHPFADAPLASGHRLHLTFPPVASDGLLISLRRGVRSKTLEKPQGKERWASSAPAYDHLAQAVRAGETLLISGATGSGKTTLANDLLSEIPGHERILALEDTPELRPSHPHFLSLVSRPPNADGFGEVTLRTLLRQTLRMRPDRIVLGECRGAEVLELLQALNTGHRGSIATLHANSPRDALRRVELLCLLHGSSNLEIRLIRELLALGVQWVAQVERSGPVRRITEVCRIEGREGETILLRPLRNPVSQSWTDPLRLCEKQGDGVWFFPAETPRIVPEQGSGLEHPALGRAIRLSRSLAPQDQ